jgi:hypothetical protein
MKSSKPEMTKTGRRACQPSLKIADMNFARAARRKIKKRQMKRTTGTLFVIPARPFLLLRGLAKARTG